MRRWLRIRLRSFLILFTLACLLLPVVAPPVFSMGASILDLTGILWRDAWRRLQGAPAWEVLRLACVIGGTVVAASIMSLVLYLGSKRGFVVFAVLAGIGLSALGVGLSLAPPPLGETKLHEATDLQLVRVALLVFGSVVPLSALLSWLATKQLQR